MTCHQRHRQSLTECDGDENEGRRSYARWASSAWGIMTEVIVLRARVLNWGRETCDVVVKQRCKDRCTRTVARSARLRSRRTLWCQLS